MSAAPAPGVLSTSLGYLLEHTVFQLEHADSQGEVYRPRGLNAVSVAFNRMLVERGARAPWMWSADRCQRFWATREHGEDSNAPNGYAVKRTEIVDFLHDLWSPEVSPSDTVVEIGCNAGANLERLSQLGYPRLGGVEINPNAMVEMRSAFPQLARSADIHLGRIEEVLPALKDNAFDVVFAMAVLHHVHPSSRGVFAEMVRVAGQYICVLEPEQTTSHYVFCRNYQRVFEGLGCRQIRAQEIARSSFPDIAEDYYGYTARLFRVPGR
jgi:SAM-dependent methyltransferase